MVVKLSKLLIESGLPNHINKSILGTKCITNLSQGSKPALFKFVLKSKLLQYKQKATILKKTMLQKERGRY